jgi:hypothetical protein
LWDIPLAQLQRFQHNPLFLLAILFARHFAVAVALVLVVLVVVSSKHASCELPPKPFA